MKLKTKRDNRGFTLIEVTVVLVLIGIIAATVFGRSINTNQISLVGQADKIRNHIRFAQSLAMKHNQARAINCDGNQYWLSDLSLAAIRLPGQQADKLSLADLGVGLTAFTVYFDLIGKPYHSYVDRDNNNPVTIANPLTITVSAGTESQTFSVTPETGFIVTQ